MDYAGRCFLFDPITIHFEPGTLAAYINPPPLCVKISALWNEMITSRIFRYPPGKNQLRLDERRFRGIWSSSVMRSTFCWVCWCELIMLAVFSTLTSILSLGEGEEEKIRMWMLVSTFFAPTQGFFSVCLKLNDDAYCIWHPHLNPLPRGGRGGKDSNGFARIHFFGSTSKTEVKLTMILVRSQKSRIFNINLAADRI